MTELEDKDIILHKAIAGKILLELEPVLERLKKQCEKYVVQISQIEDKLQQTEDILVLNDCMQKTQAQRAELLPYLANLDRVQKLYERNKQRQKYFSLLLQEEGIYNDQIDAKQLEQFEKNDDINEQNLGICANEENLSRAYFQGEVFTLVGGELDFKILENKQILFNADDKLLQEIISKFPKSVSTIGAELLANNAFKRRLLKQLTSYVYDVYKHMSFSEINSSLGELLSFRNEIPKDLETYIVGVQNMFNVMVKKYLLNNFPEKTKQINSQLKCNEKSALIPEGKFVKDEPSKTSDVLEAHSELVYDQEVKQENEEESETVTSSVDDSALELMNLLGINPLGTNEDDTTE